MEIDFIHFHVLSRPLYLPRKSLKNQGTYLVAVAFRQPTPPSGKQETPNTGENTVPDESEMASFSGKPIFRTHPVNDDPAAPYNGRVLSRVRTLPSQLVC